MQRALELARKAWGQTHPNPMVGCIIVKDDQEVAEGYHPKAGEAHAERMAINSLKHKAISAENTTLYVTLEPCSTHGRTPPCTDAILESGIKKVIVGTLDPNPLHSGRAIDILKTAGIEVKTGVEKHACSRLNIIFNHAITQSIPLIALKFASTLDGKIATHSGRSQWITGAEARENVMHWRRYFPAIGVGADTVLKDNPSLTIRSGDSIQGCPIRFIFDRQKKTLKEPQFFKVYTDEYKDRTIVVTGSGDSNMIQAFEDSMGVKVWQMETDDFHEQFKKRCFVEGITGVYIEGGAGLHSDFLKNKAADYVFSYRAPKLFGDSHAPGAVRGFQPNTPSDAIHLSDISHEILGADQLMHGFIQYS